METTQETKTTITENTGHETTIAENMETKSETTTENTETNPEATTMENTGPEVTITDNTETDSETKTTEKETNIAERIENDNNTNENTIIEIGKNHILFPAIKTIADTQKMIISYKKDNSTVSQSFEKYIKVENGTMYFVSKVSVVWSDNPAIAKSGIKDGIYIVNKNTNSLIQMIKVNNDIVKYPDFMLLINQNTKFDENDDRVDNFYLFKNKDKLNTFIAKIYHSLLNEDNKRKIAVSIKNVEYFIKNLNGNNVSFAHKKNHYVFYLECKDKHIYSIFTGYEIEDKY